MRRELLLCHQISKDVYQELAASKYVKNSAKILTQIRKIYEKQERHIVPKGTSNKWLVLFATNILGVYQKAFLTAEFAKKAQGSQRANCLFIKFLRILCFRCVLCCYLKSLTFDTAQTCNF